MSTANVIDLGLFALAAVAAGIALWQAVVASKARSDAQAARDEAADHERVALDAAQEAASAATRSADEAKRSADALEEANNLVRAQLTPAPIWVVEDKGGDEYSLISNMSTVAQWVSVAAWGNTGAITVHGQQPVELVRLGERVNFRRGRRFSSSGRITLLVEWQDINFVNLECQIDLP